MESTLTATSVSDMELDRKGKLLEILKVLKSGEEVSSEEEAALIEQGVLDWVFDLRLLRMYILTEETMSRNEKVDVTAELCLDGFLSAFEYEKWTPDNLCPSTLLPCTFKQIALLPSTCNDRTPSPVGGPDAATGRTVVIWRVKNSTDKIMDGTPFVEFCRWGFFFLTIWMRSHPEVVRSGITVIADWTNMKSPMRTIYSLRNEFSRMKFYAELPAYVHKVFFVNSAWWVKIIYLLLSKKLKKRVNLVSTEDLYNGKHGFERPKMPNWLGGEMEFDVDDWVAQAGLMELENA